MLNPFKKIRQLEDEILRRKDIQMQINAVHQATLDNLNSTINQLQDKLKQMVTPEKVIAQLLDRGIVWYDYKMLDGAGRGVYWGNAQAVLKNETYKNELNHFIGDLIQYLARDCRNEQEMFAIRQAIVALETFNNRLEQIEDPNKEVSTEGIHEAI